MGKMKVVKDIDWGKIDFIMCSETSHFPDDKKGECNECGKKIVFRPYQPSDVKKVCMNCAIRIIHKHGKRTKD